MKQPPIGYAAITLHPTDKRRSVIHHSSPGPALLNEIAPQIEGAPNREKLYLKDRFYEKMCGYLVALAVSAMTGVTHVPAFPTKEEGTDTTFDFGASNGESYSEVQGVAAIRWDKPKEKDITELVWESIEHKHRNGKSYGDGVQLLVFSPQERYAIDFDELAKKLESKGEESWFSSYWFIAPLPTNRSKCTFLVCYFWGGTAKSQFVFDFGTQEGILVNSFSNFEKTQELYPFVEYLSLAQSKLGQTKNE